MADPALKVAVYVQTSLPLMGVMGLLAGSQACQVPATCTPAGSTSNPSMFTRIVSETGVTSEGSPHASHDPKHTGSMTEPVEEDQATMRLYPPTPSSAPHAAGTDSSDPQALPLMNLQAKEPSGTSIVAAQRPFPRLSRGVLPAFQPGIRRRCAPLPTTPTPRRTCPPAR